MKSLLTNNWIFDRLSGRDDSEHEQAILRLLLCFSMALSFLVWPTHQEVSERLPIVFIPLFPAIIGIGIFLSILIRPAVSIPRRIIGIITDISAMSYGMVAAGEWGHVFSWVYLFIIMGNGFRYGREYLYLTAILALVGFVTAWSLSKNWFFGIPSTIGFLLEVTVLTLYLGTLLKRLNTAIDDANQLIKQKANSWLI